MTRRTSRPGPPYNTAMDENPYKSPLTKGEGRHFDVGALLRSLARITLAVWGVPFALLAALLAVNAIASGSSTDIGGIAMIGLIAFAFFYAAKRIPR